MSEFEYDDETVMEALADAYEADPAGLTTRLIEEVSRDQLEYLQASIDTVLDGHRQRLWQANAAEAAAAMEKQYGDRWAPYKQGVEEYVSANPDLFNAEVMADPQRLYERLHAAFLAVKPQIDSRQRDGAWDAIRGSYREWSDPVTGGGGS